MSLAGLTVPVPTLFDAGGELDPDKNVRFVHDLSEQGIDHVFVLGSLGEFPLLRDEERSRLLSAVLGTVPRGVDVWVGCGAPSTRQAVRYAVEAERAGAAALVAVPPYFLHPTPAGIGRYYRAIRAATTVPLLGYNIPSFVGYALDPRQLHALFRDGVIAGAKDTAGSLGSISAMLRDRPEGFAVLPGDDALVADAIAAGAVGGIMGFANLVPRLCVALVAAARAGSGARAAELQGLVNALGDAVRAGPFPAVDKFLAFQLRGAEVGYRSPYDALRPDEEKAVLARLEPLRARLRPYLEG